MRKAGITDYRAFARSVLDSIRDRPISFEVFSDDFGEMERQAREIASWGPNVYVKIPVSNTRGDPAYELVRRLAPDTGVDPIPHMAAALDIMRPFPNQELIWASPRELLNIFQADQIGCHIITVTNDVLKKLSLVGKDLATYSLETVQMFFDDAQQAGYTL
jgi:transaldolase